MALYYLHEINTPVPKTAKGFKYILKTDTINYGKHGVLIPGDTKYYCAHKTSHKLRVAPDDSVIEVLNQVQVVTSTFNKIVNDDNFEVWINNEHSQEA